MLFRIDPDEKAAEAVPVASFAGLSLKERYDIQEWVLHNPTLLGEPLLIIASEFSGFDRTSERLDVLALSSQGRLVVVELKRSAVGTTAELQALRYAAFCSTLGLTDIAELRTDFLNRRGQSTTTDSAMSQIRDFVEHPDFEDLDDKPRIILAAEDFGPELTATVMWLRSFQVDIRCVRLTPYSVDGALLVDSAVVIPLPEAEEFLIRRERKDATRSSSGRGQRPSIEEFLASVPEKVLPLFSALRDKLTSEPGIKETVFKSLVSYRRESDNAWITWLQFTSAQARLALPDDMDFPEEMAVKSGSGWTTLAVSNQEELDTAVELLTEHAGRVLREGGISVLE